MSQTADFFSVYSFVATAYSSVAFLDFAHCPEYDMNIGKYGSHGCSAQSVVNTKMIFEWGL
jgi:hypothetical protein